MEFRVLGPLEVVTADGRTSVGGPRERMVLAALLARAGSVVGVDRATASARSSTITRS